MSQELLWVTVIIVGALTLGIRLSFMVFMSKTWISPMVQQALRFVPVAVLSALVAPALFLSRGSLYLSFANIRLVAGILAILVAWRTKKALLTIVIGMACLLILQAFVPPH